MWLINHLFAPDLPTRERYYYIEACHKIALYEWLLRWAEMVEDRWEDLYINYPFACHDGAEPVRITLRNERRSLVALMSEPDASAALPVLEYQVIRFADALASWRGIPARACWDTTSFIILTDLSEYEP